MVLGVLAVIVLIGVGYYFVSQSGSSAPAYTAPATTTTNPAPRTDLAPVTFTLEAQRFMYTPNTVKVKSGQNVTITVVNVDTTHGIRIPTLNLQDTKTINFIAPAPGSYPFSCPTLCGSGHKDMQGTLVVE